MPLGRRKPAPIDIPSPARHDGTDELLDKVIVHPGRKPKRAGMKRSHPPPQRGSGTPVPVSPDGTNGSSMNDIFEIRRKAIAMVRDMEREPSRNDGPSACGSTTSSAVSNRFAPSRTARRERREEDHSVIEESVLFSSNYSMSTMDIGGRSSHYSETREASRIAREDLERLLRAADDDYEDAMGEKPDSRTDSRTDSSSRKRDQYSPDSSNRISEKTTRRKNHSTRNLDVTSIEDRVGRPETSIVGVGKRYGSLVTEASTPTTMYGSGSSEGSYGTYRSPDHSIQYYKTKSLRKSRAGSHRDDDDSRRSSHSEYREAWVSPETIRSVDTERIIQSSNRRKHSESRDAGNSSSHKADRRKNDKVKLIMERICEKISSINCDEHDHVVLTSTAEATYTNNSQSITTTPQPKSTRVNNSLDGRYNNLFPPPQSETTPQSSPRQSQTKIPPVVERQPDSILATAQTEQTLLSPPHYEITTNEPSRSSPRGSPDVSQVVRRHGNQCVELHTTVTLDNGRPAENDIYLEDLKKKHEEEIAALKLEISGLGEKYRHLSCQVERLVSR